MAVYSSPKHRKYSLSMSGSTLQTVVPAVYLGQVVASETNNGTTEMKTSPNKDGSSLDTCTCT